MFYIIESTKEKIKEQEYNWKVFARAIADKDKTRKISDEEDIITKSLRNIGESYSSRMYDNY
jgi:hypothetical protein